MGLAQEPAPDVNPFTLMDLPRDADEEMIRRRYRLLARKWHPDRNPDNIPEAERRFKEISEAYRVLSDPRQRRLWSLQERVERKTISYWDRLRADVWSISSQCRVVLYDLARGESDEGFALWEKMRRRFGDVDPAAHLQGRDRLDCLFLLAEEHEHRGLLGKAFELYEKVYWAQHRRPVMSYFREETRARLVALGEALLVRADTDAAGFRAAVRSVGFALPKGERARILALLSNRAFERGDNFLALRAARALKRTRHTTRGLKVSALLKSGV